MASNAQDTIVVNGITYTKVLPVAEISKSAQRVVSPVAKAVTVPQTTPDAITYDVASVRHVVTGGIVAVSTCLLVYRDGAGLTPEDRKVLKVLFPLAHQGYESWRNGQKAFGVGLRKHFSHMGQDVEGQDALVYWLGPEDILSTTEASRRMDILAAVRTGAMNASQYAREVAGIAEYRDGVADLPETPVGAAVRAASSPAATKIVATPTATIVTSTRRRVL